MIILLVPQYHMKTNAGTNICRENSINTSTLVSSTEQNPNGYYNYPGLLFEILKTIYKYVSHL